MQKIKLRQSARVRAFTLAIPCVAWLLLTFFWLVSGFESSLWVWLYLFVSLLIACTAVAIFFLNHSWLAVTLTSDGIRTITARPGSNFRSSEFIPWANIAAINTNSAPPASVGEQQYVVLLLTDGTYRRLPTPTKTKNLGDSKFDEKLHILLTTWNQHRVPT